MRQTAVVGSQKRLTRCFRELEVASQQHKKLPKSQKHFIARVGVYRPTSPIETRISPKFVVFQEDSLNHFGDVSGQPAEKKITVP